MTMTAIATKVEMKLFVWENVLEGYVPRDYYSGEEIHENYGVMIAFASDIETARSILREKFDNNKLHDESKNELENELAKEPKVFADTTYAFAIRGCFGDY